MHNRGAQVFNTFCFSCTEVSRMIRHLIVHEQLQKRKTTIMQIFEHSSIHTEVLELIYDQDPAKPCHPEKTRPRSSNLPAWGV